MSTTCCRGMEKPSRSNSTLPRKAITRTFCLSFLCYQQNLSPAQKPYCTLKSNELLVRQDAAGGNHAGPSAEGRNLNQPDSTLNGGGPLCRGPLSFTATAILLPEDRNRDSPCGLQLRPVGPIFEILLARVVSSLRPPIPGDDTNLPILLTQPKRRPEARLPIQRPNLI